MNTLDRILLLIQEKCESEQEFLRDFGLGKNTVSEWKSGKTVSYKKRLPELSKYFNVPISYLAGETDDSTPRKELPDDPLLLEKLLKEKGLIPKDRRLTKAEEKRLMDLLEVATKEYKED